MNDHYKNIQIDTQLVILRLANQRSYCSFVSLGILLATIAYSLKKYLYCLLGILILIASTLQFYVLEHNIDKKLIVETTLLYYLPVVVTTITVFSIIIMAVELHKKYGFKF
jgi:hypothetical protein